MSIFNTLIRLVIIAAIIFFGSPFINSLYYNIVIKSDAVVSKEMSDKKIEFYANKDCEVEFIATIQDGEDKYSVNSTDYVFEKKVSIAFVEPISKDYFSENSKFVDIQIKLVKKTGPEIFGYTFLFVLVVVIIVGCIVAFILDFLF